MSNNHYLERYKDEIIEVEKTHSYEGLCTYFWDKYEMTIEPLAFKQFFKKHGLTKTKQNCGKKTIPSARIKGKRIGYGLTVVPNEINKVFDRHEMYLR